MSVTCHPLQWQLQYFVTANDLIALYQILLTAPYTFLVHHGVCWFALAAEPRTLRYQCRCQDLHLQNGTSVRH